MARVTAAEVKAIMSDCTISDSVVETMINAATEVITDIYSGDTDIGTTLQKEIERWYVAHMLASTVCRMGAKERLGEAQVDYTGIWGKGLESTPYGQMVLQLDTTGKMANVGKKSARIRAVESFD